MVREISIISKDELSEDQIDKIKSYFSDMPVSEILIGLKFAKNRWDAKDAGTLKVGRKSIINNEVHSITAEQATWRLNNQSERVKVVGGFRSRPTGNVSGYSLTSSTWQGGK